LRRRPAQALRSALGFALSVTLLALAPAAAAADGFDDRTPLPDSVRGGVEAAKEAGEGGGSGAFVRMIVGLAVVLAVIYGVYWLLKAYGKSKKRADGDGRMQVVATTVLAPERSIHLVRIGDELVLVGSAEKGVSRLRVYDAEEARRLEPLLEASGDLRRLRPASGGGTTVGRLVDELRRRTARE
jgi:flagellar protein FliO/FliZ